MKIPTPVRRLGDGVRNMAFFIGSGVCEKDQHKTEHLDLPLVLSSSRLVVVAFALVWLRAIWVDPELLSSWPVATAGIFFAIALPVVGALKSTKPEKVLEWANGVVNQLGRG